MELYHITDILQNLNDRQTLTTELSWIHGVFTDSQKFLKLIELSQIYRHIMGLSWTVTITLVI